MSFVSELRRRQVFRAAAWYGGLAWLAVEVSNTVFPQFGLPEWSVRAVIVTALLGLPVALLLAWSLDLSSTGLRREDAPASHQASGAAVPWWRVPSLWLALAIGAGLTVSAQQAWQRLVRPAFEDRPGLAVLPFANLSPDPENAYFADGLHEEILGSLATVSGLRVISSTSVQQYRESKGNLRDIAEALGVSLVLEGSVRRVGDDLRLSVQLIDGRSDERLWAETYDREFRDALDLQRTVARQVVAAIGARLSTADRRNMQDPGTKVPAAYERYLQALASFARQAEPAQLYNAVRLLDEAIALDVTFARAYALRARTRIVLQGMDQTRKQDLEAVRSDIERALALQPLSPDTLVARAMYRVYVSLDPAAALEDLSRAIEAAPNDAEAQQAMGFALRRLGRFDEAIRYFEVAATLTPGQSQYQTNVMGTLLDMRRYDEALDQLDSLLERYPAESWLAMARRFTRFLATGDVSGWREDQERLEPTMTPLDVMITRHLMLVSLGDLPGLISYYESTPPESLFQTRDYVLGVSYAAVGDRSRALPHLQATAAAATALPDDQRAGQVRAEAAVALELLGERAAAQRMADRAVRDLPASSDAVNSADVALRRAWVLIHSGERAEEGYSYLARLMGEYGVHGRYVAREPLWQLLRDDQRTQQIIRSHFSD